jgi:hypothetical protein
MLYFAWSIKRLLLVLGSFALLVVIVTAATFAKADDYADGLAAVQRQDYDLAIRMFTPLAEAGSIDAQTCRMDAICGKPPATSA